MIQDSYVTNVGEYPVAPNVTVDQFLVNHPEYNNDRYRTLLMQQKANWITDEKDWNLIHSKYDSWVSDLNNAHLANVERWKTKYASPLNQSELLEAAGYNRNWLQGASGSMPDIQAVSPSPGDAGQNSFDPAAHIFESIQGISAMVGQAAQIRDQLASADLKEAQATKTRQMLPFQMGQAYFPIMEGAKKHGYLTPSDEMYHFEAAPGYGVDLYNGSPQNFYDNYLRLQNEAYELHNKAQSFSNRQKDWIYQNINPINLSIAQLQKDLLDGNKTLQDYQLELEKIIQPARKKYAPKAIGQDYWLKYVDTVGDMAISIGNLIAKFKGVGVAEEKLDWEKQKSWMYETGEVPEP